MKKIKNKYYKWEYKFPSKMKKFNNWNKNYKNFKTILKLANYILIATLCSHKGILMI